MLPYQIDINLSQKPPSPGGGGSSLVMCPPQGPSLKGLRAVRLTFLRSHAFFSRSADNADPVIAHCKKTVFPLLLLIIKP